MLMTTAMNQVAANRILALLPQKEAEIILPHTELVEIHLGDLIDRPGEPIQNVFFPLRAAISMIDILDERHTVEVSITGPEGCSGASVVQGTERAVCRAMVQIGGPAVRVSATALVSRLDRLPYLQGALQRYNALLLRHAVISVGCNRFHSHSQRLARWLSAHRDRTGLDTFPFTLELFAAQVGLDRSTVAELVGEFQRQSIVTKEHRTITIMDHDRLTAASCDCFAHCKESNQQYVAALKEMARGNGG
jgi:hypothetical protein